MHCLYFEVLYDQDNYFSIVLVMVVCGKIITNNENDAMESYKSNSLLWIQYEPL